MAHELIQMDTDLTSLMNTFEEHWDIDKFEITSIRGTAALRLMVGYWGLEFVFPGKQQTITITRK